jgi:hypothetical protein
MRTQTWRFSSLLNADQPAISSMVRWQPSQKSLAGFMVQIATQGEGTA